MLSYKIVDVDARGEFPEGDPYLSVMEGEWLPVLDDVIIERLGGAFRRYMDRFIYSFELANVGPVECSLWYNEYYFSDEERRLLVPEQPSAALIVTGPQPALDALVAPLSEVAELCRSAQQVPPEQIPALLERPHDAAVRPMLEELSKTLLTKAPRNAGWWHKWRNAVGKSSDEIEQLERELGVTLPVLIKDMLRVQANGFVRGHMEEFFYDSEVAIFPQARATRWFNDFHEAFWRPLRPHSGLIPICGDGHWDMCLDYRFRGRSVEPKVTLVDNSMYEETVVAETFAEYIGQHISPSLLVPGAGGVTTVQIAAALAHVPDLTLERGTRNVFAIFSGVTSVGLLSTNGMDPGQPHPLARLPEYKPGTAVVHIHEPDWVMRICRCLTDAHLLEGSVPAQTWWPNTDLIPTLVDHGEFDGDEDWDHINVPHVIYERLLAEGFTLLEPTPHSGLEYLWRPAGSEMAIVACVSPPIPLGDLYPASGSLSLRVVSLPKEFDIETAESSGALREIGLPAVTDLSLTRRFDPFDVRRAEFGAFFDTWVDLFSDLEDFAARGDMSSRLETAIYELPNVNPHASSSRRPIRPEVPPQVTTDRDFGGTVFS